MHPFRYGRAVTGEDFCLRRRLVEDLRDFLVAGQNVAVLGERCVGNTSLIFETDRRVRGLRLVAPGIVYGPKLEYKFFDLFCRQWVLREL